MTSSSNCLICYEISQSNHINEWTEQENNQQCQMLNIELLNMFVLRKLLRVSPSFCEFLLLEIGSPSEWIFCCETCSELIHSIFAIHNNLLKLFSKAEALRKKIETKLHDSGPRADYMSGNRTSEIDEKTTLATTKSKITEEIRNYYFFGRDNTHSTSNINTEVLTTDSDVSDSDDYIEIQPESNDSDDQEPSSPVNMYLDPEDVILGDNSENTNEEDNTVDKHRPEIINLADGDEEVVTKINCKEAAANRNQQHDKAESESIANSENSDQQISENDCVDEIASFNEGADLLKNEKIPICTSLMSKELEQTEKLPSPFKQQSSGSFRDTYIRFTQNSQKIKFRGLQILKLPKPSINIINYDLKQDGISASENATQSFPPTEVRFKCGFCTKDFKILARLTAHQRSLHYKEANLEPYECKPCNRIFANSTSLEKHTRKVHSKVKVKKHPGPCKCQFCDREFSTTSLKNVHLRGHHYKELNLNPYQCKECGKILTTPKQLRHHITLLHKHDYVLFCPICNRGFVEKKDMLRHIRAHNKEKPFVCTYCGKGFAGRHALRAHEVKSHTQDFRFECPTCNKKCVSRVELKSHTSRIHTDNPKPFVCEICARSFYDSCNLKYHQRGLHYQELNLEPLKCTECDTIFNNIETLRYHRKAKHLQNPNFACSECGKTFFSKSMLSYHFRRIHKKEKLLKCTTCSKCFFNSADLKKHTARHAKDHRFKCKLCTNGFSFRKNLEQHMSVVHGEDPAPK